MRNSWLEEAQAGIKTAGRNNNNLRYTDGIHPYGRKWRRTEDPHDETEREEWKSWLKTQHSKTEDQGITLWQIDGEKMEIVTDFIFLDSKITADGDCSHEIKRCLTLKERLWQT